MDPHISPTNSIAYYEAVRAAIGEANAQNAVRFFLLPGVYHCQDGEGFVRTDVLTPIVDWVERGVAPEALIMTGADGTRPVFPFPALARYSGTGDRAEASSYVAEAPATPFVVRRWIGEALFSPPAK